MMKLISYLMCGIKLCRQEDLNVSKRLKITSRRQIHSFTLCLFVTICKYLCLHSLVILKVYKDLKSFNKQYLFKL